MLTEDAILFAKVHPPGEGDQHEPEWIQDSLGISLVHYRRRQAYAGNLAGFKQIRFRTIRQEELSAERQKTTIAEVLPIIRPKHEQRLAPISNEIPNTDPEKCAPP